MCYPSTIVYLHIDDLTGKELSLKTWLKIIGQLTNEYTNKRSKYYGI